jgi:hypothetical protein
LDHRWLVKLVQDGDGPHNVVKGVGKRSDDGHNSQLIIEVVQGEGRGRKRLDDPDVFIYPVDE